MPALIADFKVSFDSLAGAAEAEVPGAGGDGLFAGVIRAADGGAEVLYEVVAGVVGDAVAVEIVDAAVTIDDASADGGGEVTLEGFADVQAEATGGKSVLLKTLEDQFDGLATCDVFPFAKDFTDDCDDFVASEVVDSVTRRVREGCVASCLTVRVVILFGFVRRGGRSRYAKGSLGSLSAESSSIGSVTKASGQPPCWSITSSISPISRIVSRIATTIFW